MIGEYRKGSVIYGPESRPSSLYVVLAGKVKICRSAHHGQQVVLDVYQTDEFFGESSLIGGGYNEMAVALENTRVMSWGANEIREIVLKRPDLGYALLQLSVQRTVEFGDLSRASRSITSNAVSSLRSSGSQKSWARPVTMADAR